MSCVVKNGLVLLLQEDFFQIQHETVVRQSNAITSKMKKYENEYSKCDWVKEDVPFVIAMSSYS